MTTEIATAPAPEAATPPARVGKAKVFGRRMDMVALSALARLMGSEVGTERYEEDLSRMRRDVEALALDLAGGLGAPPAVDCLANAAALAWLEWNLLTVSNRAVKGRTLAQAEYADRAADRAHRRFVRSIKALAEIRRTEPKSINLMNIYADFRGGPTR